MTETRSRYDVTIERDDDGMPTRLYYSPSTPVYPDVAIESHDLTPCVLCGGVMVTCGDLDLCSSCGSRRVRSQAKQAAAASRDASLTAFVDDLLDLLQEVGGMSAEWCADKLAQYETLLSEG